MTSSIDKIDKLASQILNHKKHYYSGTPIVSDCEFDRLEEALRNLAPNHPILAEIGSEGDSNLNKIPHRTPMLSLQKSYNQEDLLSWANEEPIIGTYKIDGNSLSLYYEKGTLKIAKTRGNGKIGEDVLEKTLWVPSIPKSIPIESSFEVRGEIFCKLSGFQSLSDEMIRRGLEKPNNPRNIVAGLLGRKSNFDLAIWFHFYAFDAISYDESINFISESNKINWLNKMGFEIPPFEFLDNQESIISYLEKVKKEMEVGEIAIDGAVFCYDNISKQQDLGSTSHHPRFKMSFKWQGTTASSPITKIKWATSRLGIVTPVAVIEPVDLSGATITNVTLHNAEHVKNFRLKPGDIIEITRSGEVIPKFLRVTESTPGEPSLPKNCPSCGEPLEFDEIRLKCLNSFDCSAQIEGSILNWIKCIGIDDLSDKRLSNMVTMGLVTKVPDLYDLTVENLLTLPLTKEKMAIKIHRNIQLSKKTDLAIFLNSLGIEGMGLTTWEKLITHHPSLVEIKNLSKEKVIEIDGFAEKSAGDLILGLKHKSDLIKSLIEKGFEFNPIQIKKPSENQVLTSMSFVITGKLSKPRSEIVKQIKKYGGTIQSTVSKNTSILIINDIDSSSSKAKKARELGIESWSEEVLNSKIESI